MYNKSKHISSESIISHSNNLLLSRRINNQIYKLNTLAIDTGIEIVEIKELIKKKVIINIVVQWTKGHPKIVRPFIIDSVPYLITICHRKVKVVRKNIN